MTDEVELVCAVYGEGTVFPVKISRDAKVSALQKAIFDDQRYHERYSFPSSALMLYLARKDNEWLKDDRYVENFLQAGKNTEFEKMRPSWILNDEEYFGEEFQPGYKEIHILVEPPVSYRMVPSQQSGLWLVRGSISNALNTKGVRCRLYRLAGSYLGYYDPSHQAFWYEDKTLSTHILFETKENALRFENVLHDERMTINSPLNGQVLTTTVEFFPGSASVLKRIFYEHYEPQETESPQDTMSSFSVVTSIIDTMTDEFKYQRIESEVWFGPVGKAQSCYLMSHEHCKNHDSYNKYDRDKSNRLAMSPEMHSWYDALTFAVPVMNICVESISQQPVINNRYEVKLIIYALDAGYGRLISMRLKEGSSVSTDNVEMRTSVYVENPKVFRTCMEWKYKQIQKSWQDYYSMTSPAD